MFLDESHYSNFNGLMDDLDTVISLLRPGVNEIAVKCGPQLAKRLRTFLKKLRYLQRDAFKYIGSLIHDATPN